LRDRNLRVFGLVHLGEGVDEVEDEVCDLGDVTVAQLLADAVGHAGTKDKRVVDALGLEDLLEKRPNRESISLRKFKFFNNII
jgi:hypothetical protein